MVTIVKPGRASRRVAAAVLGLLLASTGAHAGSVFACRTVDGARVYQDRACAPRQEQSMVQIAPAPPPAAAHDHALPAPRVPARRPGRTRSAAHEREPQSYECRADNGEVFYRHSTCPRTIHIDAARSGAVSRRGGKAATANVTGTAVARADACKRMRASGFSGRAGHERDDRVSTYERNLGRDPCR